MDTKRAPAGIVGAAALLAVWAMLNHTVAPRRIAAGIVGAAAFFAVWAMTNYIVDQIGSGSPELAVYHNLFRVCVSAFAGIAGAALVLGKR